MIYPYPPVELRWDEDLQWILHRLARWTCKRFLSSLAKERFSRFFPRLCRYWTREVDLTTSPGPLSAVLIHLALIASTERKCWSSKITLLGLRVLGILSAIMAGWVFRD